MVSVPWLFMTVKGAWASSDSMRSRVSARRAALSASARCAALIGLPSVNASKTSDPRGPRPSDRAIDLPPAERKNLKQSLVCGDPGGFCPTLRCIVRFAAVLAASACEFRAHHLVAIDVAHDLAAGAALDGTEVTHQATPLGRADRPGALRRGRTGWSPPRRGGLHRSLAPR